MFLREFDLQFTMKIWDSLLALGDNFPFYILYLSDSILSTFSSRLLLFDSFSGKKQTNKQVTQPAKALKFLNDADMIDFIQKMPVREWGDREYASLMKKAEYALDRDLHKPYAVNRIFRSIQQDSLKTFAQLLRSSAKRLGIRSEFQERLAAVVFVFIFVFMLAYCILGS